MTMEIKPLQEIKCEAGPAQVEPPKPLEIDLEDRVTLTGICLIWFGIYCMHKPASYIFAGVALIAISQLVVYLRARKPEDS